MRYRTATRLHPRRRRVVHGVPVLRNGQGGLNRNLSTAEILEQVRAAAVECGTGPRGGLSNVVFMGMGERWRITTVLGRCVALFAAPPNGFGISARSVTCRRGLAPAIRKLADERLNTSRCSLAARSDDELRRHRSFLSTTGGRWLEALDAARYYADVTGRRVSIEYALIRDINDQLGGRSFGQATTRRVGPLAHVNVIP